MHAFPVLPTCTSRQYRKWCRANQECKEGKPVLHQILLGQPGTGYDSPVAYNMARHNRYWWNRWWCREPTGTTGFETLHNRMFQAFAGTSARVQPQKWSGNRRRARQKEYSFAQESYYAVTFFVEGKIRFCGAACTCKWVKPPAAPENVVLELLQKYLQTPGTCDSFFS